MFRELQAPVVDRWTWRAAGLTQKKAWPAKPTTP
jgi:hypothetical protein